MSHQKENEDLPWPHYNRDVVIIGLDNDTVKSALKNGYTAFL